MMSMTRSLRKFAPAEWFSRAADWWLKELTSLLPERIGEWLLDHGARQLVIAEEAGGIRLMLRNGNHRVLTRADLRENADLDGAIDAVLRQFRLKRSDVALGVAVPDEAFFTRSIRLPREAGSSLDSIAMTDLLRNTPFRADDIHFDFATHRTPTHIQLEQHVIRKDIVQRAVAQLGLQPEALAFVENSASEQNRPVAHIRTRKTEAGGQWARALAAALLFSGCLMGACATMLVSDRQSAQTERLEADMAKARAEAYRVRAAADASDKQGSAIRDLRTRKQQSAGLLEIWEELTRILPETASVHELRLAQTPNGGDFRVTMTGLSSAAANLVETLDRSPLLSDVALTAPISIDPIEKRERFVLEAKVTRERVRPAQ
jgi:general secretion pathway protein L